MIDQHNHEVLALSHEESDATSVDASLSKIRTSRNNILGVGFASGALFTFLVFIVYSGLGQWSTPYLPRAMLVVALAAELAAFLLAATGFLFGSKRLRLRLSWAAWAVAVSTVFGVARWALDHEAASVSFPGGNIAIGFQVVQLVFFGLGAALAAVGFTRAVDRGYGLLAWAAVCYSASCLTQVVFVLQNSIVYPGALSVAAQSLLVLAGLLVAAEFLRLHRGRRTGLASYARREGVLSIAGGLYLFDALTTGSLGHWTFGALETGWRYSTGQLLLEISRLSSPIMGLCLLSAFVLSWTLTSRLVRTFSSL